MLEKSLKYSLEIKRKLKKFEDLLTIFKTIIKKHSKYLTSF